MANLSNYNQLGIETEYEKRFLDNACEDYCSKLCPERYTKLTQARKCFCSFKGVIIKAYDETLRKQKWFQFECTIEHKNIKRIISIKEIYKLYERE